jgi:serine/threonine protein kinase
VQRYTHITADRFGKHVTSSVILRYSLTHAQLRIALDWENLSCSTTTTDSGKTLVYAVPEVTQFEKRNTSADVWSLGCVFLEVATVLKGETAATMRAFFQIRTSNYRFYANIQNPWSWVQTPRAKGAEKDNTVFK